MDRIEFTAEGSWTLRHLVDLGDGTQVSVAAAVAQRTAAQQSCAELPFSNISALEITGEGLDQIVTGRIADEISWVLSLALGQTVSWTVGRFQHDGQQPTTQVRNVRRPSAVAPQPPLKNNGAGRLRDFLQAGHANFVKDREWWRLSLDWWVQMHQSPNTHIVGLLASILLERAGDFHLAGMDWSDQIDAGVDAYLTKKNCKLLASELDDFFKAKLTAKWETHRSVAVIGMIKGWNNSLSYKAKVTKACGELGVPVPPKVWLDTRNDLAHQGELSETIESLAKYHGEVRQTVTALLLKLLTKA